MGVGGKLQAVMGDNGIHTVALQRQFLGVCNYSDPLSGPLSAEQSMIDGAVKTKGAPAADTQLQNMVAK